MFGGGNILSDLGQLVGIGGFFEGGAVPGSSLRYEQEAANKQMDFQREMFNKQIDLANTAHQREVKDLIAAGINPVLTATGGGGANVPSAGGGAKANTNTPNNAMEVAKLVGLGVLGGAKLMDMKKNKSNQMSLF